MVAPKAKSIYDMPMSDFDNLNICPIIGNV